MNPKNFAKKFFGHLRTVNQHRLEVMKLCFKCGLYWQGLTHDLSKYSPVEFLNGVKYYTGKKSPHIGERADKGYSDAWMHHKGRNKHHMDYWTDIDSQTGLADTPIKMPWKYVVEMFCDRVAASKIYAKNAGIECKPDAAYNYYMNSKRENTSHPETAAEIEYLLKYLADNGEEAAFKKIKEMTEEKRKNGEEGI